MAKAQILLFTFSSLLLFTQTSVAVRAFEPHRDGCQNFTQEGRIFLRLAPHDEPELPHADIPGQRMTRGLFCNSTSDFYGLEKCPNGCYFLTQSNIDIYGTNNATAAPSYLSHNFTKYMLDLKALTLSLPPGIIYDPQLNPRNDSINARMIPYLFYFPRAPFCVPNGFTGYLVAIPNLLCARGTFATCAPYLSKYAGVGLELCVPSFLSGGPAGADIKHMHAYPGQAFYLDSVHTSHTEAERLVEPPNVEKDERLMFTIPHAPRAAAAQRAVPIRFLVTALILALSTMENLAFCSV